MIKYLGSKRKLLPVIKEVAASLKGNSVLDLFSGTSRVGHALKGDGYRVISNDHNAYAYRLGACYVQADLEDVETQCKQLVSEFNSVSGQPGYFTKTFCEDARFFHPRNGAMVDAIRGAIVDKCLPPEVESVMLVSLMEAADRVDSTCGIQMAYLKKWAPRALKDLTLRMPNVLPQGAAGKGEAFQLDADTAVRQLSADIAYVDPPYNQHSYLGNYHAWESLVLWDKPEAYGIARKRVDVRERKSDFNSKVRFRSAMQDVVDNVDARALIVSFSNEGYIAKDDMVEMLSVRGDVSVITHDYKRYVGAQIGIHGSSGEVVGEVSHLRNEEYIFVVDCARSS